MLAPSDNSIMEQVREGEVNKLGVLFERHHLLLFNFFLRSCGDRAASEDLVQEVFLRILRYRHTFRGESKFTVWMFSIARNTFADHYRKRQREQPLTEEQHERAHPDPLASEALAERDEHKLLHKALARLSPEKREVLLLSRFQELKYEDIAEMLHCPVGTIKARVHWALKDLREHFLELTE